MKEAQKIKIYGSQNVKKLTSIKPKTNYKEGVRKFIEWYLRYHKK